MGASEPDISRSVYFDQMAQQYDYNTEEAVQERDTELDYYEYEDAGEEFGYQYEDEEGDEYGPG
jgi:hypothetical protein